MQKRLEEYVSHGNSPCRVGRAGLQISGLPEHCALSMCSLIIRKSNKDLSTQISLKEREGISSWEAALKRDFLAGAAS